MQWKRRLKILTNSPTNTVDHFHSRILVFHAQCQLPQSHSDLLNYNDSVCISLTLADMRSRQLKYKWKGLKCIYNNVTCLKINNILIVLPFCLTHSLAGYTLRFPFLRCIEQLFVSKDPNVNPITDSDPERKRVIDYSAEVDDGLMDATLYHR